MLPNYDIRMVKVNFWHPHKPVGLREQDLFMPPPLLFFGPRFIVELSCINMENVK